MSKTDTRSHLLTIDEAAEFLLMHPRTVRRKIAEKEIAAHRFGRSLRISTTDLDTFVKTHREA